MNVKELEYMVYQKIDVVRAMLEASEKVRIASDDKADEFRPLAKSHARLAQEDKFNELRLKLFDSFEDLAVKHGVKPLKLMFQQMHRATSSNTEEEFASATKDLVNVYLN